MCVFAVFVFWGILFFAPHQLLGCPLSCECFAVTSTVKCVSKSLLTVPKNIPGYARTLILTGNHLHQIGPDSFKELKNVTNIILSNNRDALLVSETILNCQSRSYSDAHLLRITELASHTFSALTNLRFLDLSANQLALIHPEALSIPDSPLQELNLSRALHNFTTLTDLTTALRWGGLWGLLCLDLSGNHLALLPPGMFSYVPSLQQLLLSNNSLLAVCSGTFSGMAHLELLDLTHNAFNTFRADGLLELDRLGNIKILLGNNPYTCTCEIHEFVTWLNKSRAQLDVEAVRCSSPEDLNNTLLRGLTVQAVGCVDPVLSEVADITLPTSYVFLGLVLGLVGMVFLFVLYLNRNGMKKWITDTRDACRDVLEGYHYRYEIDSDPRLGHITAGGSRSQRHVGTALSRQQLSDTRIVPSPTQTLAKQVKISPAANS